MPLVRIDTVKKEDPEFIVQVGDIVYRAMRAAINIPENDHFQVLNEHSINHIIYDDQYLGIERTDQIIFIQITLNEGRTIEQKKSLFQTIVTSLNFELQVRIQDVFINLVEVKKENWSFGNGIAQYAV